MLWDRDKTIHIYRSRYRAVVFLMSLIFSLAAGEAIVRATGVDWRYLKKNLFYFDPGNDNYTSDPDPYLIYRLRPDSHTYESSGNYYDQYSININTKGARSPEYSDRKPDGVFRIFCFGGSNVFGDEVGDEDAWPAQLERLLNERAPGRFEVWNFGTVCHVYNQTMLLAWESIRYQPDLMIFGLSNAGQRAFLRNGPVETYFIQNPELWIDYLPMWTAFTFAVLPRFLRIEMFDHLHFVRFDVMGISAIMHGWGYRSAWLANIWEFERRNRDSIRDFAQKNRENVSVCFFVGPYAVPHEGSTWSNRLKKKVGLSLYKRYYQDLDVPVLLLPIEKGQPETFERLHPPPEALTWYATRIADWLVKEHLIH